MIRLLEEVGEPGFGSAAFLTYGVDLGFFEAEVMNRLQEAGCRNVIVVADGHQLKEELNSVAWLRYVGVYCPIVPVRLGNRAFHPKALLMVGEEKLKLLIGSGNLTLPGYTRNWELFTRIDGEEATEVALDLLGVFEDAANRSPLSQAFTDWCQRLERFSPWLFGGSPSASAVRLLCSSEGPILPRVRDLLSGREVDRILAVSPFFDVNASALRWLVENFAPRELTLLVDEGVQLDPVRVEDALSPLGEGIMTLRFVGEGRPLHGKGLLFEGPWGEALLAGSPNLSFAALLGQAGIDGNFELAAFQLGSEGDFSLLFNDRLGPEVSLQDLRTRKPGFPVERVYALELEAAWISDSVLHAVPVADSSGANGSIQVRLERHGEGIATHRLDKESASDYRRGLEQEDLIEIGSTPTQARLLDDDGQLGAPVWIQNLDVVEKRSSPLQRARYARGLKVLSDDLPDIDPEAWENLFGAFLALANGWHRRAEQIKKVARQESIRTDEQNHPQSLEGSFYVSREEVTLELPAYFAKAGSDGLAIGDYDYLMDALPTARRLSPSVSSSKVSRDALATEEDENGEELPEEELEPLPPQPTEEQKRKIGRRLLNKFRSFVREYADSLDETSVGTRAEANYQCSRYTLLHKATARAADVGYLDAAEFRSLASWLTDRWTADLWAPMQAQDGDEVEAATGCATFSLAAIAAIQSPYVREQVGADEFDADLYSVLFGALKYLRPFFIDLREDIEAGLDRPEWENAVSEYVGLWRAEVTPLDIVDDLKRRYRLWLIEEETPLQRALEAEGIYDSASLEGDVLNIRSEFPDRIRCQDLLCKLIYLVHNGTDKPAAVVWKNTRRADRVDLVALVLLPADRNVLDITRPRNKKPNAWIHSYSTGPSGSRVYLTNARYLGTVQPLTRSQHSETADIDLLERAADMVPSLFQ